MGERDGIDLECPECAHTERAGLVPTLRISADLEFTVKSIRCGACGYEGPPDPEGDGDG